MIGLSMLLNKNRIFVMVLTSMFMMQLVSTSHAQQRDWENPHVFGINKLPYHATLQPHAAGIHFVWQ